MNRCIDCNREISKRSIRCSFCAGRINAFKQNIKGRKNPKYKDGRTLKKYYCKICDKVEVSWRHFLHASGICLKCSRQGKKNPNYKNGKYSGIKYCECGKKIFILSKYCASCAKINVRNPSYIHGKGHVPYTNEFTRRLKFEIRKRDNFICQNCGMTEKEHLIVYGQVLEVHHIDYDKTNCNKNNLITTCKQCNVRANFNRKFWRKYFENKTTI